MAQLPVTDIEGYLPLVDPRRRNQPVIVDGANFLMDADGPVSGFGRTILTAGAFASPAMIQSFDVSLLDKAVYCTNEGIFERINDSNEIIPLYPFDTALSGYYPWTTAEVGGKQYFLRRGSDLIEYDPNTDAWSVVSNSTLPANIYAITQSGGRLIALAVGLYAWSAIDDAADFAPSLSTGAGFQSLSIINATKTEDPLLVLEFQQGFIVYTKQGLVVAELVDSVNPFRHDVLSRKHAPLSAYAITQFGDYQHVFMSRQGLFQTNGQIPEIFSPLMSEYFHDREIPRLNTLDPTTVRLLYNDERQWFFVSIADQPNSYAYNRAFVMYVPTQRWGRFNRAHRGIVDVHTSTTVNAGVHIGYVDLSGDLYQFNDGTADLVAPVDTAYNRIVDFRLAPPLPAIETADETIFTSWVYITDDEQADMSTAGFYDMWAVVATGTAPEDAVTLDQPAEDSDIFTTEMQVTNTYVQQETRVRTYDSASLDAFIEVGLFRGGSVEQRLNHLSYIIGVAVGALEGAPGDEFEDYLLDFSDTDIVEDWNDIADDTEDEDWGVGTGAYSDFGVTVKGTLDGRNVWQEQEEIATLVLQDGSFTDWACYVTGLFHILRISAEQDGQSFHVKTLAVDINEGGLLP